MSTRTHHFRIGLFVLVGAVLFVCALFAMGLKSYFGEKVIFETYLPGRVENLSVGALVKLRGVTVGKVTSIKFIGTEYPEYKEQSVVVCFEIPKDFQWNTETNHIQAMLDAEIARGLRARVEGQGFIGPSILGLDYVDPTVYPVEALAWKPVHYYIPSAPSQFNRVMGALEKTLLHVENLDVADALARAKKLIDAADQLVANINRVNFNDLGTNATSLIAGFRETNRSLQRMLADAQGAINGADLPGIRRDTAALEAKLSGTVVELRRLLAGVDTSKLNDSLANIRSATDELTVLLHTLEDRPSAVIFSKPPEPVKEMDTPPSK